MRSNPLLPLLILVLCVVMISGVGCAKIMIQTPALQTCTVPPFDRQSEVQHVFDVIDLRGKVNASGEIRLNDEIFTVDHAKDILAKATEVAQEGKGKDFACKVNLSLNPTVASNAEFQTAELTSEASDCVKKGIICTEKDFYYVVRMNPSGVKLVNRIDWCGKFAPGRFLGCSERGGHSIIVESECKGNICPRDERVLWLHEFGHVQGLPDRPDQDRSRAVMKSRIAGHNTQITNCDCLRFRKNFQQ